MKLFVMVVVLLLVAAAGAVVVAGPVMAAVSRGPVCVRVGAPCSSWWHPHDRTGDVR